MGPHKAVRRACLVIFVLLALVSFCVYIHQLSEGKGTLMLVQIFGNSAAGGLWDYGIEPNLNSEYDLDRSGERLLNNTVVRVHVAKEISSLEDQSGDKSYKGGHLPNRAAQTENVTRMNSAATSNRQTNSSQVLGDLHNYRYLINPRDTCTKGSVKPGETITLLIVIATAPSHRDRRDVLRQTWIRKAKMNNVSTRALFLLGTSDSEDTMRSINEEAATHGDIVQEDFRDSYKNLSIKTIMGFKWADTFCPNSDFAMKTDDDVVINIIHLVHDLTQMPPAFRRNYVVGEGKFNEKPIRDKRIKWYTSFDMYPGDEYPKYPHGKGYVMSTDVVGKLYRASQRTPLFPWEDVYVGILLEKVGVSVTHKWTFYLSRCINPVGRPFVQTKSTLVALQSSYTVWDLNPAMLKLVWEALESKAWPETNESGWDVCRQESIKSFAKDVLP